MIQKILPYLLIIIITSIGLRVIIFPFTSGENAYYVNGEVYINIKDSVDKKYEPHLSSVLQQKQSEIAFEEKKVLRAQYKGLGDSLTSARMDAQLKKDFVALKKITLQENEINSTISDLEFEIDDKHNLNHLSKDEYLTLYNETKQNLTLENYVIVVANQTIQPVEGNEITWKQISTKKVNQQRYGPFLLSGFFILLCSAFIFLNVSGEMTLENKKTRYIAGTALIFCSLIMVSKIYYTFSDRILFDKTLSSRENIVKAKLLNIRTAELNYYEAKNRYCNDWEELIRFYKSDSIKIIKYLVNKNDTAAVNLAKKNGQALEKIEMIPALTKAFPNQKINLDNLPYVPFSENPFELNAGIVDKNGRNIHVFEVKTSKYEFVKELATLPENFDKDKSLIVGSMNEPTTEANW